MRDIRQKVELATSLMFLSLASIIVAYLIFWAVIWFKFSREWAAPLASGISVCGVSAAIATAILKVFIDIFIGVWAFLLAWIWTKHIDVRKGETAKIGEIWERFPKFVIGYARHIPYHPAHGARRFPCARGAGQGGDVRGQCLPRYLLRADVFHDRRDE
jgi:hypothetical protein